MASLSAILQLVIRCFDNHLAAIAICHNIGLQAYHPWVSRGMHGLLTLCHERANALLQVSADGEVKLYGACVQRGITMLSIAHRPALKQFHSTIVHFDGSQAGQGWSIETIDKEQVDKKASN